MRAVRGVNGGDHSGGRSGPADARSIALGVFEEILGHEYDEC
jgi:hypothetical protein